jgi:transposase
VPLAAARRLALDNRGKAMLGAVLRGNRAIGGGRCVLRQVMFQAALVASHHDPVLKTFAARLRKAGKPFKVMVAAVAWKLAIMANGRCKSPQKWIAHGP